MPSDQAPSSFRTLEGSALAADPSQEEPKSSTGLPPVRSEGPLSWRLGGVIKAIRPHQWVKNVFVLAPVIFAKEIFASDLLLRAAASFGVFCLLAGAVYVINDIADIESDRQHPVKRYRPIPSGRVPLSWARWILIALMLVALISALNISSAFFIVSAVYFAQNVAYSFKLKHVAYLDVSCIALGFVLRVMGGGYATGIDVSKYLLLCTALLALFLGFGKRRHELSVAAGRAALQRAALESYTKRGLDIALWLTGISTVVAYLSYTLDSRTRAFFKTDSLWWTSLFVVLAILRFLHLVRNRPRAESPTQEIVRDGPFVAILLTWVVLVMWVVYNLRPGS